MSGLNLFEILERSGMSFDRSRLKDFPVRSVVNDSKSVQQGSVFVAIRGVKINGNTFARDAVQKGAGLVLTDQDPPSDLGAPALRVPNARLAYALLISQFYGNPCGKMSMVGITGTNGKTTSAFLVHALASAKGEAGLIGTIHYFFGNKSVPATHTTPDASELHRLFDEMHRHGCWLAVMEASSHALDQDRLAGIRFDSALFTNLTQDHLDYHKTMEQYLEAKAKLFGLLKDGGTGVLNADDPAYPQLKPRVKKSLSYGIDAAADLMAVRIRQDLNGSHFDVECAGKTVPFETVLFGRHNIYNIVGSVGTALSLGIPLDTSARIIAGFKGVPGRLERVEGGQDFTLFVDYAHTDDGLKNVLSTLRPSAGKKLMVLFGCGGDRDRGKRPKMARVAESLADYVMLTSDNPRFEDPQAILKEVAAGFSSSYRSYETQADRRKAIRQILLKARKGDVVLLAGKGHEDVQVIGDEKVPFNDKEEALKVLNGL